MESSSDGVRAELESVGSCSVRALDAAVMILGGVGDSDARCVEASGGGISFWVRLLEVRQDAGVMTLGSYGFYSGRQAV